MPGGALRDDPHDANAADRRRPVGDLSEAPAAMADEACAAGQADRRGSAQPHRQRPRQGPARSVRRAAPVSRTDARQRAVAQRVLGQCRRRRHSAAHPRGTLRRCRRRDRDEDARRNADGRRRGRRVACLGSGPWRADQRAIRGRSDPRRRLVDPAHRRHARRCRRTLHGHAREAAPRVGPLAGAPRQSARGRLPPRPASPPTAQFPT